MTLENLLLEKANPEIKLLIHEFQHAPWDYKVFGPLSLEDEAIVHIYLSIGRTKKMYDIVLAYNMNTGEITREQVHTNKVDTLDR